MGTSVRPGDSAAPAVETYQLPLWKQEAEQAQVKVKEEDGEEEENGEGEPAEAMSEWARAAMAGLPTSEGGWGGACVEERQAGVGAGAGGTEVDGSKWYYTDDSGGWQGPFLVEDLRKWRAMLPMELRVVGGSSGTGAGDGGGGRDRWIVLATSSHACLMPRFLSNSNGIL